MKNKFDRLNRRSIRQRYPEIIGIIIFYAATTALAGVSGYAPRNDQRSAATVMPVASQQDETNADLREAAALLQAGQLDAAEPVVRRALQRSPRNADAHNLLGVILDQRGRTAEAEKAYRTSLRLQPGAISPRANLGVLLTREGRHSEAITTFESVLQMSPEHPQATTNLGLLYAGRGDHRRAASLLTRANELEPGRYDILLQLGVSLYHVKSLDLASRAFEAASSANPSAAEPFHYRGLIAIAGSQDELAGDLLLKAIDLRPDYAEALFMLGEVLRKHDRIAAAREFYERAVQHDSSKAVYQIRLGGVYIILAQFEKAFHVFQQAAQKFPNLPELDYYVGLAARGKGDFGRAQLALRRAISRQPNNADALALLGAISRDRGEMVEAERLLRRAVSINNVHFNAHHDLGSLLITTRRFSDALPALRRAAELNPREPDVRYKLFLALSRLGRKAEAEREFEIFKQLESERKKPRVVPGVSDQPPPSSPDRRIRDHR